MQRKVEAETLDGLAPDDPRAMRSRRDLRRINGVMGSRAILDRALQRVLPAAPGRALRLVEIGCGDGRLMLEVVRDAGEAWCGGTIVLLDRQPVVAAETVAAYAALGWHAETRIADALDLAETAATAEPPYDAIVANLFLHHFEGDALARLLRACAARASAFVACEPRRSRFALCAAHLVGCIGANAVTREDAVLSVRAGFAGDELQRAWSSSSGGWQCDEYDDGLFTHCLCAMRTKAGASPARAVSSPAWRIGDA